MFPSLKMNLVQVYAMRQGNAAAAGVAVLVIAILLGVVWYEGWDDKVIPPYV